MRAPESHVRANELMGNIALGLLGFTLLAFGLKAVVHPEVQARYTPIVVFHAGSMVGWLALLVTQAFAAARFRLAVHRAFGRASLALVAAMLVSGGVISWRISEELGRPEVTVVNLAAFATFIPLYILAIRYARQRDIAAHRQAMLIATLALMTPAYARVVQVLGLPDPVAIGVQPPITILIACGYDWVLHGRVTRPVLAMLGFSVGLVVVMSAVLAVLFL
ncbi:hypothetical protein [Erythrobacter dokdonensis]|uniref:Uncharacterized protein n=1 Tax=Erythrobacter dokdonensis DSW-74 TaxID=1300349 RepID=A0A1A7BC60_9SPHN|nr:hypothetical protein [Erythrobacter dokdonensis]OBV10113.1 hypothetical protein I603_2674 [Erythrobacter dokdonensis DSW-74]